MKRSKILLGALVLVLTATMSAPAMAQSTYELDPVHSQVVFKVKHLGVSYNYGRFDQFEGTVKWDAANPGASMFDLKVATQSVNTGNDKRDQHLRSNDFFNAKQFPVITFRSKSIKKKDGNTFTLTGDLMLHGVTKTITTDFEFVGEGKDPWGGYRAGGVAEFKIKRSDYGMDFMVDNGAVGDEVTIMVNIEAVRK